MIDYFPIRWPDDSPLRALTTFRTGGYSQGACRGLNLASHVGDDPAAVELNRQELIRKLELPGPPLWINQVHGTRVVNAQDTGNIADADADGCYTTRRSSVCAVLTADCLPVFIADPAGSCAGVFHAGWRGLANGVLANAVSALRETSTDLVAALGPAISQAAYETGDEVRQAFLASGDSAHCCFTPSPSPGHYYTDLYRLARLHLEKLGIRQVWADETQCTFRDAKRYYSYRREGRCGRMASLIWISEN